MFLFKEYVSCALNNLVTTGLIFITFDWLRIPYIQPNAKNNNPVETQLRNQNALTLISTIYNLQDNVGTLHYE